MCKIYPVLVLCFSKLHAQILSRSFGKGQGLWICNLVGYSIYMYSCTTQCMWVQHFIITLYFNKPCNVLPYASIFLQSIHECIQNIEWRRHAISVQ